MSLPTPTTPVMYPESDGLPMADNTLQFRWIQVLSANLDGLYKPRDDVFVGGNLFWYPVENFPTIVQAPDVFVVMGRPPGYRTSPVGGPWAGAFESVASYQPSARHSL